MTDSSLAEFPELAAAHEQAQKAATLLETAAHNLTHYEPDEPLADRAQRLRGAAVIASTAAQEVMGAVGWHEAAAAAASHGLLG